MLIKVDFTQARGKIKRHAEKIGVGLKKITIRELKQTANQHFKDKYAHEADGGWRELKPYTYTLREARYGYYEKQPSAKTGIYQWTGKGRGSLTQDRHPQAIRREDKAKGTLEFGTRNPEILKLQSRGHVPIIWERDAKEILEKATPIAWLMQYWNQI